MNRVASFFPPPRPNRALGVCIAGSSVVCIFSLGSCSRILGLDSSSSLRCLACWEDFRLVGGDGGRCATSLRAQCSLHYLQRCCSRCAISVCLVKYGRADTPTTSGPPSGTRAVHFVTTLPQKTRPEIACRCRIVSASLIVCHQTLLDLSRNNQSEFQCDSHSSGQEINETVQMAAS